MADPFRLCDIRGRYPDEVNEELLRRAGARIASRCAPGDAVLAARDHRLSSPSLHRALLDGLTSGGVAVLDAGTVPTPVLYYGKRTLPVRYAVSVTASHNPPDNNGLKVLPPDQTAIAEEIVWIAGQKGNLPRCAGGSVRSVDLLTSYTQWLNARWRGEVSLPDGKSLVLDPGNGLWSGIAGPIFRSLGLNVSVIHDEPLGSFPHRSPDCTAPHQVDVLGDVVRQTGAVAGFAWDGDGDRLVICDDGGSALSTDQVALLTIPELLARNPGETILADVKMSRRVREAITAHGGKLVVERSAHCMLEQAMKRTGCLCGYEYSGHFFFRELDGADDGLFAALDACSLLSRGNLSEAVAALPELFITPDVRIPGDRAQFQEVTARLCAEFAGARFDRLDGLRIDMDEGWLLVRQSISENRFTWRAEGDSKSALSSILGRTGRAVPEVRDILGGYA